MNMIRIELKACSLCVAAFAILGLSGDATAQTLIVVPPGLDAVEGDSSFGSSDAPANGARAQVVYPATDFSGLPLGQNTVTSMAWRVNHLIDSANTTSFDMELRLSSTSAAPGTLSNTFADNFGASVTPVYLGPVTLHTKGAGPPGGPRPFDYLIEFQTHFEYDPNQNLLVDFTLNQPSEGMPALDAQSTSLIQFLLALDASETIAEIQDERTFVAQFHFIPEPSSFVIAALGLVGLLAWRRKKGQLSRS